MRRPLIVGNWKMHKTSQEAKQYVLALTPQLAKVKVKVMLAVPYTAIHLAAVAARGSNLAIGAQNVSDQDAGAFTGEISASMLKEVGATFTLLGHSERRQLFYETSPYINRKCKQALAQGLDVILCIGENQEQRDQGRTEEILSRQLQDSLAGLTEEQFSKISLAYEPVWAIGTGKIATPDLAQSAHAFCRTWVAATWGKPCADQLTILYGGSVKPGLFKPLLEQPDIDGALVGGASLDVHAFIQLIQESAS